MYCQSLNTDERVVQLMRSVKYLHISNVLLVRACVSERGRFVTTCVIRLSQLFPLRWRPNHMGFAEVPTIWGLLGSQPYGVNRYVPGEITDVGDAKLHTGS